ncbi:hypothetical protein [Antrihabitans stalactiti]|uniref:Uncharacterized protein n=1 Tax=Antrihabitans stalactiti TaxID=2584121 RepID=A0A848K7R4_9NOCA|nr:hypothetical protein [Antrihabitans stalactiti]NMN93418.1 hypothetical protein [Antrihabitans stalactiti]
MTENGVGLMHTDSHGNRIDPNTTGWRSDLGRLIDDMEQRASAELDAEGEAVHRYRDRSGG